MKLGFFTACLPGLGLDKVVRWAADIGYDALEIAAWPKLVDRPDAATHLDVDDLDPEAVRALLDDHAIEPAAVSYYDNNLHPDPERRAAINAHVRRCIDAAAAIGSPTVGTFVGRDPTRTISENLAAAEAVFAPLVDHAGALGVALVIENCPMEVWHPDAQPGNLAYSPELWEWMFGLGLRLNFDPSHLVRLGIDPVPAYLAHAAHIPIAQAKDVERFPEARQRYGWPGPVVERDRAWWRYRVPGLGEVDWRRLVDAMYEHGFDGTLAVEHEDPVWDDTEDRVRTGLEIAHGTLRPLVVT